MAKRITVSAALQCSECDFLFVIRKVRGKQKQSGHIKHMYCMKCCIVQPFVELKEQEYDKNYQFWITFHLKRKSESSSEAVPDNKRKEDNNYEEESNYLLPTSF